MNSILYFHVLNARNLPYVHQTGFINAKYYSIIYISITLVKRLKNELKNNKYFDLSMFKTLLIKLYLFKYELKAI